MKILCTSSYLILLLSLTGCAQDSNTGIRGNDNDNNQITIVEKGDAIVTDRINITYPRPDGILRTELVPQDILKQIFPGISISFAKQLLGEAIIHEQYDSESTYIWRFDNAYIQILSLDDNLVDAVTLVRTSLDESHTFKIHPLDYELGSLKPADLDCDSQLQHDYSSKFYSIFVTSCYFGNYLESPIYYEFGAYEGGNVQYEGDMVEYGGEIAENFWNQPFNYVSIAFSEDNLGSIRWVNLR